MTSRLFYAAQVLCTGAALGLMAIAPASAEPWQRVSPRFDGVPPQDIVASVISAGLRPLDRPVRRGPTYVVHALGEGGREMRVVVDARRGEVLSVRPVRMVSRLPPSGPLTMGPYERMNPGYVGPEALPPPGFYAPRPPGAVYSDDDSDDAPVLYGTRETPPMPPPVRRGTASRDEPRVIMATPQAGALLPPPPDRYAPHRPAQAKPMPPKRAAAAAAPKPAPLPKPKPDVPAAAVAPAPAAPAEPAAKPAEPQARPSPAPAGSETPPAQGFE